MSHVQSVPLSADTELRIELVSDPTWYGPALDIRLWRRPTEGERIFSPTAAGFRLPPHLVEVLAYAMQTAVEHRERAPSNK